MLDDECDKERSSNMQRGLPHTPSVIDMGHNALLTCMPRHVVFSGVIAFRKLVLLAPSMLPKLSDAVAALEDIQVAHKVGAWIVSLIRV